MSIFRSRQSILFTLVGLAILIGVLFAAWIIRSKHQDSIWLQSVLGNATAKNQLVYKMGTNLLASAEAEKSAVMADTDETSQAFADQARRASEAVEEARQELGRLLEARNTGQEMDLFHAFSDCWQKFQEVDHQILPLAVQNTNLKAMRLSFGPAGEALKDMETALHHLMDDTVSSPNAVGITRLCDAALTGALKIYALQAPHIAETSDIKMDEIETRMKRHDGEVNEALNQLQILIEGTVQAAADRSFLDEAKASYLAFQKIDAEIINLSRQNSNIRSFSVSLGVKRKVTAQCQQDLTALQEAIHNMDFKATR